jgi:hypothetical protein
MTSAKAPEISPAQARAFIDKIAASDLYQRGEGPARELLLDVQAALYNFVYPETEE